MRSLAALPKAHLHLHLDGAMRASTLSELALEAGTDVPEIRGYGSFEHFSATIQAVQAVLRTREHVERLVTEVVEDAADAGAVWLELSMWPGMLPSHIGPRQASVEVVLDAGVRAARRVGIGFGLMLAANRNRGPDEACEVAGLACAMRESGVVAFGLDGDEHAFPPELFADAFLLAKRGGLLSTPHAGELAGPEGVRACLDILHADRIMHGVRAIEDPTLIERLRNDAICLDICPTSNFMLSVVSRLADHPLPHLLRQGIRLSINADDPLLFNTSLLQEYELCRTTFGLTDDELASVAKSSIEASGAPIALKMAASAGIGQWLLSEA